MKTGEMHALSAFGTVVLTAALVAPTVWLTQARANTSPPLQNYEVIEASLAYAPENAKKATQPQKVKNTPPPEVKPEGVSRDETKKVDDKKEDKKEDKVKPDPTPDLSKFTRTIDDEAETGGPQTLPAFDGSKFGFGNVSKGHPYFQRLVADMEFAAPELAKEGSTPPQGCIQITAEGKIPQIKFRREGDGDLQSLAEAALKRLQSKRNDEPIPVPTELLRLTTEFLCFDFKAASS